MNRPVRLLATATTLDEAVKNLLGTGCTRLVNASLPGRFARVIPPFARLTESSDADSFQIRHPREFHEDGTSNLGLRIVRKGDAKANPRPDEIAEGRTTYDETKFYYHASPRVAGYLAGRGDLVDRHRDFLHETSVLYSACYTLLLELAGRLDFALPGYHFERRVLQAEHLAVLRLLRYLCESDNPNIAKAHRDQNLVSIHIKSDRPQLWLADAHGRIIEDAEETRDDSVLIFFSRKMWEVTRGRLPGIIHGVLDPMCGQDDRTPRHTAVFFGHVELTEAEKQWGKDHAAQLSFPPHIAAFAKGHQRAA